MYDFFWNPHKYEKLFQGNLLVEIPQKSEDLTIFVGYRDEEKKLNEIQKSKERLNYCKNLSMKDPV